MSLQSDTDNPERYIIIISSRTIRVQGVDTMYEQSTKTIHASRDRDLHRDRRRQSKSHLQARRRPFIKPCAHVCLSNGTAAIPLTERPILTSLVASSLTVHRSRYDIYLIRSVPQPLRSSPSPSQFPVPHSNPLNQRLCPIANYASISSFL